MRQCAQGFYLNLILFVVILLRTHRFTLDADILLLLVYLCLNFFLGFKVVCHFIYIIFVRLCTCVYWSASSVLRTLVRDCFRFHFNMPFKNATCGLQMPLCAGCCQQKIFIRGFKGRALWLYTSRPQHFQRKSYCCREKSLSLSYSHPNNVPLPFHVLFISPQLQEILLLFNCFQRLNPLHTKSVCHYIKYYLMPGLKQKNYWSMCCS